MTPLLPRLILRRIRVTCSSTLAVFAIGAAGCAVILVLGGPGCTSPPATAPPGADTLAVGEITTFAGKGLTGYNGSGKALLEAALNAPCDVTVDPSDGDVWIIDYNNGRVRLAHADTLRDYAGVPLGLADADPNFLNHPAGLTLDAHGGRLLLAWHNHQIRRIDGEHAISNLWGTNNAKSFAGDGGPARDARFAYPSSAAWGADSTLYISDAANLRIRAVRDDAADLASRSIVTVAGTGDTTLSGDGTPGLLSGFDAPVGDAAAFPALRIAMSPDHHTLYIADTFHHRVRAMDCVDAAHPVRTVAGSGPTGEGHGGFGGDGSDALAARFNTPTDVDVDGDGTVYVCDAFNNRVRAFLPGGAVRTVAGTGVAGFSGDRGMATAARLNQPNGIALDTKKGLLYIADLGNNRIRVVRLR